MMPLNHLPHAEERPKGASRSAPGVLSTPVRPRAIVFDWDNTLVDSWTTIHDALNITMAAMQRPLWSLAETKARVRLSLRQSFPLHFGERWEEAREIYLGAFRTIHLDRLTALPGRARLLADLAAEGFFLAVVSNKTGSILRREAAAIGWSHWFGTIVGAGDAAADKPDPAPMALALEPSGLAMGEAVWYVGDTGVDVECARNSGCVAVLLGGEWSTAELAQAAPQHVCPDCESLFRLVKGL